jgi:hypothetical protein
VKSSDFEESISSLNPFGWDFSFLGWNHFLKAEPKGPLGVHLESFSSNSFTRGMAPPEKSKSVKPKKIASSDFLIYFYLSLLNEFTLSPWTFFFLPWFILVPSRRLLTLISSELSVHKTQPHIP